MAGRLFSGEWLKTEKARRVCISTTRLLNFSTPLSFSFHPERLNPKGLLFGRVNILLLSFTKTMTPVGVTPADLNSLSLSYSDAEDTEDLFASPSMLTKARRPQQPPEDLKFQPPVDPPDTEEGHTAAHEASLRRELASVRSMNQVISGVVDSLEKAKTNMETVSATVFNASNLLTTWTRILSQTEHNQRLILNSRWQGASQDIADGENEVLLRRQEKERREAEEASREEAREKEEEERRRMTEGATTKGPRGRGRGVGRAVGRAAGNEYVGVGGQGGVRGTARAGGATPGRVGSGSRRSMGSGRGRLRGPS